MSNRIQIITRLLVFTAIVSVSSARLVCINIDVHDVESAGSLAVLQNEYPHIKVRGIGLDAFKSNLEECTEVIYKGHGNKNGFVYDGLHAGSTNKQIEDAMVEAQKINKGLTHISIMSCDCHIKNVLKLKNWVCIPHTIYWSGTSDIWFIMTEMPQEGYGKVDAEYEKRRMNFDTMKGIWDNMNQAADSWNQVSDQIKLILDATPNDLSEFSMTRQSLIGLGVSRFDRIFDRIGLKDTDNDGIFFLGKPTKKLKNRRVKALFGPQTKHKEKVAYEVIHLESYHS